MEKRWNRHIPCKQRQDHHRGKILYDCFYVPRLQNFTARMPTYPIPFVLLRL